MSFGIDYGTSNSVLAHFDGQQAYAVPVDMLNLDEWSYPNFELLFPSVVGYSSTRPDRLFGWEAKLRSEESVEAVKRLLRGDERITLAGEEFEASTVVAGFFDALRRRAAGKGLIVDRGVVTVPANAACAARFRTRAAARVSGIQVQALLNEPTAAAIAYSYDVGTPGKILVFDWGGGTVDVTILQYDDKYGLFEEQATRGIPELGGLEHDERLRQLILAKLGKPPQWSPAEWAQFSRDVERTKIRLSTEEFAVMSTPDFSRTIEIERDEFESRIDDLVAASSEPLRACLADLRMSPEHLDAILLIGGTSQIPLVRRRIEEILDAPAVSAQVCEPLTAVARGAAIAAAILDEDLDMDVSVATTHALGTVSKKGDARTFSEIIPRNATLPRVQTKTYTPNGPNRIGVEVWEGDPDQPLDSPENFQLGKITADLPPGRTQDQNKFALTYTYDKNGLTGDVASEGVNMHKRCHHLIHYDPPWSLIRIEQRNGRIDRYGQVHQPEFAALILISRTEGAKDDTTVAEKLLAREATAHGQLGTAEGVTRQFTSKKEEDRLVKDLLAGKTVDESIEAADGADPAADFLADLLAGVGDQPENPAPDQARVPRLFESTEAFARAALHAAAPELRVDDDGELLAFRPPDDLEQRLSVLPPSYLKRHDITERMRVTFHRPLAQQNLDEAQRTKTLWPEIAYLSDLHPMIEWLTDKVLLRVPRQQAPVLIAAVDEPAFLVQGVYSNALGQPTVVEWMAVTGLPGEPRVQDMTDALQRAKVGPDMVNTLRFGDIARLQDLVPAAVEAARGHLEARRATYDATIDGPIEEYRTRLVTWEQLSLDGLLPAERGKREKVRETAGELGRLTEALRTAGEPLLRILAVLAGDAGLTGEEAR